MRALQLFFTFILVKYKQLQGAAIINFQLLDMKKKTKELS